MLTSTTYQQTQTTSPSQTTTLHSRHREIPQRHNSPGVPTLLDEKIPEVFQSDFRILQVIVVENSTCKLSQRGPGAALAAKWFYHILSTQMPSPDSSV